MLRCLRFSILVAVLAVPALAGTIQAFRHMQYLDELISASRPLYQYTVDDRSREILNAVKESAQAGDVAAQFDLAFMYWMGLGAQQDFVQAYVWFNRAQAGQGRLGNAAKKLSLQLFRSLTFSQLESADRT